MRRHSVRFPVYFDTVSAQVKLMIDRCNCLMPYIKHGAGTFGFERRMRKHKKGIFIAVAGTAQEFDKIRTTVKGFFNWASIELIETILYSHDGNLLGSVKNDTKEMKRTFEAGIRLVDMIK
jgi:multimeric flavodoxin WrbA